MAAKSNKPAAQSQPGEGGAYLTEKRSELLGARSGSPENPPANIVEEVLRDVLSKRGGSHVIQGRDATRLSAAITALKVISKAMQQSTATLQGRTSNGY